MKKFLIPEGGKFYKANLHCHTTVSDGKLTPNEVKELYKSMGYSIVAFTDHDVLIPHNDLTDDGFLALNGYEADINELHGVNFDENRVCTDNPDIAFKEWNAQKSCHICFIALDPNNDIHPLYNPIYARGFADDYLDKVKYDTEKPFYNRVYSGEKITEMMTETRNEGFFVTYNHPVWSMEDYRDYTAYSGMHAMEICNYGCVVSGYDDYNPAIYDDMLRSGKRIYAVAADDNHNHHPRDSRHNDSGGGYVMIKADSLDYKTVTDALLAGDFYASQGAEINALWLEDGKLHIECAPADCITLNTGARLTQSKYDETGNGITSAEFEITPNMQYFRVTVTDKKGAIANTNAYFTDEVL